MELIKRDPNTDVIFKSLDVVKNFIIEKGLILTGGMVVDISLKMKGKMGLYSKEEIPDYDCLSPNFYEDSLELTSRLDFADNVGTIPAMHVQTYRTRVDFVPVADITYVPKNVFDKIPFLIVPDGFNEAGMKIIDPQYQIIDQYRSMSYPLEGFPRHVIFNRLKKDMLRHDLIADAYPFEESTSGESASEGDDNKSIMVDISKDLPELNKNFILFGKTAFQYITNKKITTPIEILTDDYTLIKSEESYNPTIDIIPEHKKTDKYIIYNNLNNKICKHKNQVTVSCNAVFMYLLFKYHMEKNKEYLEMYLELKNKYQNTDDIITDTKNMYGVSNKTESYLMKHEEIVEMSNGLGKKESKRFKLFYPKNDGTDEEKIKELIESNKHLYDLIEYKRDGLKQ